MAQAQAVIAHWAKMIEEFHTSSLDFYEKVERAVAKRQIPDIEVSRVDWKESGVLSAKREYLRVRRGPHAFDVCGAPFGTGFFVSSWFARMEAPPVLLILLAILFAFGVLGLLLVSMAGFIFGSILLVAGFPFLFKVFVTVMHEQHEGWDDGFVGIPYVGPVYQCLFRPETYYKMDTAQMFQQSVHNAVMEAVDEIIAGKGVRALTELERMPVAMSAMAGR